MGFEVEIEGIFIDRKVDEPVIMLKEKGGDRRVPIWIQMGEMFALAIHLAGDAYKPPRPFTHDLIQTVVHQLEGEIHQVHLVDIVEQIYRAKLSVAGPDRSLEIDARPSDAILLGLKFEAPIYLSEKVFESNETLSEDESDLKQRLQQLRPQDFINFAK